MKLKLIRPASLEPPGLLAENLSQTLVPAEIILDFDPAPIANPEDLFPCAPRASRIAELVSAVESEDNQGIWCVRGGYGVSDLLADLPWERWTDLPQKPLIGFSDFSALHSAFYTKLGWPGIHGPMPGTDYWHENGEVKDINRVFHILRDTKDGFSFILEKAFTSGEADSPSGRLFGGCMSVLTNLIGTPYIPGDLSGHILFWEDIGEPPPRILRWLNQWIQSGMLRGVEAIVLGNFFWNQARSSPRYFKLHQIIHERTGIPVYSTSDFGHCSPNFPIMIGAHGEISQGKLNWQPVAL